MFKKPLIGIISIIVASISALFNTACNSTTDTDYEYYSYSSTAVTAFSLQSNANVLENLDSIFFSIDLEKAQIFNASPLPVGTKINRLLVNITTDNCSAVELSFKSDSGNDTIVNYLENSSDSINFANGPVRLHVVSYDEVANRDYTITINVFQENPDSMVWHLQTSTLPSQSQYVTEQKTTMAGNRFYMITSGNEGYSISSASDPYYFEDWSEPYSAGLTALSPVIDSFTGVDNGTLYILSSDNMLYESVDEGKTWSSTDLSINNIYGNYLNTIIGGYVENGSVYTIQYPSPATPILMSGDFPVGGTSHLVTTFSSWQVSPQSLMVGGRKSNGELTDATWGFDGEKWAKLNLNSPGKMEYATIFPYTIAQTDTVTWRSYTQDVIMLMGGVSETGEVRDSVFYSNDLGVHWTLANEDLQLPPNFVPLYKAQGYSKVHELTISSRAIAPITEWDCPYIYLFGGFSSPERFRSTVWQGVINRFTMVPIE